MTRLTPDEWAELLWEISWVAERVKKAFAPDHFNYSFLMNMDHHVHLHVLPRYIESRELAGVKFKDDDYPSAYQSPPLASEISPSAVIAAVDSALRAASR